MNNELVSQKSWWGSNWKWVLTVSGILLALLSIFISAGMIWIGTDLAQAYSDTELYENAIHQVESNPRAVEVLGVIGPIDKLAILEGEVHYFNKNQSVRSTIRVNGTKGNAKMDLVADRVDNGWAYKKINVRITNPPEDKQTIEIIEGE